MPLVTHIVGTRPNFVKAAPVIRALEAHREIHQRVVHTGQHYDSKMSDTIISDVGMRKPDANLRVGSGSHANQTAAAMLRLDKEFDITTPDLLVVYGDVNSTLAAALVAVKRDIPIAHVEAGLRSFDRTMPEEINRIVVDSMSTVLFTTSPEASENLVREGVSPDKIHFVGNTMIDTLDWTRVQRGQSSIGRRLGLPHEFALVTIHRPGNLENPARLRRIVDGLCSLSSQIMLVFPVHPRGRKILKEAGLGESRNLLISNPVGYIDSTWLVENSKFIITDSGGLQEEATALGTTCYTVRENTERPVTLVSGTNNLIKPYEIARLYDSQSKDFPTLKVDCDAAGPEKWDGRAASRIGDVLVAGRPTSRLQKHGALSPQESFSE